MHKTFDQDQKPKWKKNPPRPKSKSEKKNLSAPAGNRTRVCTVAGYYLPLGATINIEFNLYISNSILNFPNVSMFHHSSAVYGYG
jgi:hypothetical protein